MKKLILALILSTSVFAEIPSFEGEIQSLYECEGTIAITVTETDLYIYDTYDVSYDGQETQRITPVKAKKLLDDLEQNCLLVKKCTRRKFQQISTCTK